MGGALNDGIRFMLTGALLMHDVTWIKGAACRAWHLNFDTIGMGAVDWTNVNLVDPTCVTPRPCYLLCGPAAPCRVTSQERFSNRIALFLNQLNQYSKSARNFHHPHAPMPTCSRTHPHGRTHARRPSRCIASQLWVRNCAQVVQRSNQIVRRRAYFNRVGQGHAEEQ